MTVEETILGSLITDEKFVRQVLPYLQEEYFLHPSHNDLFQLIKHHVDTYNVLPTVDTLSTDLETSGDKHHLEESKRILTGFTGEVHNLKWLTDTTEEFCKQKAIYLAVHEAIEILDEDGKSKKDRGAIPKLLEDALAVSFNTDIGHDYLDDAEARWEFYHNKNARVPFDIDMINEITDGGVQNKTLCVLIGGTGFGKTATMCHFAASNMVQGKNVLYITLEMEDKLIAERIDANLLDIDLKQLREIPKETYFARMNKLRSRVKVSSKSMDGRRVQPTYNISSVSFMN